MENNSLAALEMKKEAVQQQITNKEALDLGLVYIN